MSNTDLDNLHSLLKEFVYKKASDLFITSHSPVMIKLNGLVVPLTKTKIKSDITRKLIYSMMNKNQLSEFKNNKEINFSYSLSGVSRFRVNVFVQRGEPGMVVRAVNVKIPNIEELKLPAVLNELIMEKRGLILFVGATGAGKSTSLAALIGHRNSNSSGHIITVEDPIEFMHRHDKSIVTQREVGTDTISYDHALKNTLRQAPDVILIGEIRSREVMEHAIAYAETGHLCLSTLHANNTNQSLDRIINFFSDDRRKQLLLDLSLNLKAIISQRLIPKVDGTRVASVEVLINTPRVADLILKGDISSIKNIMSKCNNIGMQTFDQSLFELYEKGLISYEEALYNSDSENDLRLQVKLKSKRAIKDKLYIDEDNKQTFNMEEEKSSEE